MDFERSVLRYAHTTGFTSLIYNEEDCIFSCGNDGDLRKWRSIDDDDPTSSCLGEFVICIAQHDGRLLASTDRNTVQAYKLPEVENDGVLMRFTAPVTCLFANKKYIAAGSEDTNIKIQKVGSKVGNEAEIMVNHSGPVLSLDISPVAPVLVSVGGDGQLKVWNLDTGAELKSIVGLVKVNSFESASCYGTPAFEPSNGKLLAYVRDKEICVLNTSTWELQFALVDEAIHGNYTCCRFSSDGKFLAAGTTSGEISVFDFLRKKPLKCEAPSNDCQSITCLTWKPSSNKEIAFCDASGQLGMLTGNESATVPSTKVTNKENVRMDFDGIELDMNNDNVESTSEIENIDNNDDGISIEKLKSSIMKTGYENISGDEDSRDSITNSFASHEVSKKIKQQPVFQPSSTPNKLDHRYLVWNEVGIVTRHVDESDGSIDVEFHDASIHHALHIPNSNGHDMASLSSNVLALAATNSSKLVCIALASAGNKEWTVEFPDCESVEAVTASTKIIAVATSCSFLRLFTVTGTQREIISIPGPVLSMAGFKDLILVCYHSAPTSETRQHISAMILQIRGLSLKTQHIPIPLPAGRQMTWLGFSDAGSPVFADSMGLVQLFSLTSNCWYPICDTLKQSQSVSNNYFIISVSERQQIIQAVLCRGCAYPMTNPRPLIKELRMHLELCDPESDKSELEDQLMRASLMVTDNADSIIKETALKLFALACRNDNESRARDLIETIGNVDLLQLAVKYATKLGRIHLSERLYDTIANIQQLKDTEELAPNEIVSIALPVNNSNTPRSSENKIAPIAMDLASIKRSKLKRFSSSPTPSSFGKKFSDSISPLNSTEQDETQENKNIESIKDSISFDTHINIRSPLNSVNPFAAKRKLEPDSDIGQKGILLGTNKLKIAKK